HAALLDAHDSASFKLFHLFGNPYRGQYLPVSPDEVSGSGIANHGTRATTPEDGAAVESLLATHRGLAGEHSRGWEL
ncbi:hypothetical protein NL380_27570, partial [Klebsiella pneumoniae]|nr:hypothetical protein [Klebsiella pneumoniae]